jgi:hypothetical protein
MREGVIQVMTDNHHPTEGKTEMHRIHIMAITITKENTLLVGQIDMASRKSCICVAPITNCNREHFFRLVQQYDAK